MPDDERWEKKKDRPLPKEEVDSFLDVRDRIRRRLIAILEATSKEWVSPLVYVDHFIVSGGKMHVLFGDDGDNRWKEWPAWYLWKPLSQVVKAERKAVEEAERKRQAEIEDRERHELERLKEKYETKEN